MFVCNWLAGIGCYWAGCRVLGFGTLSRRTEQFNCNSCRPVGNGNCDQGAKPVNRKACNTAPCAVTQTGLQLSYTPWGGCSAQCGGGYSSRAAYCTNAQGELTDVAMCGANYTGQSIGCFSMPLDLCMQGRITPSKATYS